MADLPLKTPPREQTPEAQPMAGLDAGRRRFGCAALGAGWTLLGGGLLSGCVSLGGGEPELQTPSKPPSAQESPTSLKPFSAQDGAAGGLPEGWEPYIIRRGLKRSQYQLASLDGRGVLHARADGASSGLNCHVRIDPLATPWMRWSWRADAIHEKATVSLDEAEDTPARIILAFEGDISRLPLRDRIFFEQVELFTGNKLPYATLAYAWDGGEVPVGRTVPYARSKRLQNHVVESGPARVGQWLSYERNVADDFRRVFGEAPPGVIRSVGVLTDSDDLKNSIEAWYGDIGFSAEPSGA